MKHYLFKFTIQCGEYEFSDNFIMTGKTEKAAAKKAHKYLMEYYGDGAEYDENYKTYFYNCGEVSVKKVYCQEISESNAQIISQLQL